MSCDRQSTARLEENSDRLLAKTKPIKILPTPPRINDAISLDVDCCLSWGTSPTGANDLERSKVRKAPANVRVREAKNRDKA
jgi:hypothetical protein